MKNYIYTNSFVTMLPQPAGIDTHIIALGYPVPPL